MNEMNEEATTQVQEQDAPQDMYDFEIGRFQELAQENTNYSFQRYGLTLLYSLPPEETFKHLNDMNFSTNEALDEYNKGALECQNENLDQAMKHFEKAESMECDVPELFYNIAAIHEEKGNKSKAKEYYQKYVDRVEQYDQIPKALQEELDEVREQIKEL